MIPLKSNDVTEFFKKEGLNPQLEKESKQQYFTIKVSEKEIPVFFRVMEEASILQLIAYPPTQMQEETFGEIARFLHILNKELDVPGFGMDEKTKLLFYRVVIPSLDKEIDDRLMQAYIKTMGNALTYFFAGIEAAAQHVQENANPK